MKHIYQSRPLFKSNYVDWNHALASWKVRQKEINSTKILEDISILHKIAEEVCTNLPRFHWLEALEALPQGESRFVWCLMFCKATNGVSDVVVCRHFQKAIAKQGQLTMKYLVKNPEVIAEILRQTSKWAKNTVSTC